MDKPDLNKMWETFIRIGEPNLANPNEPFIDRSKIFPMIRRKIYPMIARLQNEDKIDWYCFLIHNRASGVPTTEDDHSWYFHIRVSRKNDGDPPFPEYCVMTRKIEREEVESISGITKSLLKNDEIEEAWRMIGEQSEWLLHLLSIYKEDDEIPADQVWQFLRYLANMTQMSVM